MVEKSKRQEVEEELAEELSEDLSIEEVNRQIDDSSNSNSSMEKGSHVWDHFNKSKDEKGIVWAKCQHCDKGKYNLSVSNFSTGNMIKHLKLHPDKLKLSIKKQSQFMVKFLQGGNSQFVSK